MSGLPLSRLGGTAIAACALQGCALEPGQRGLPIVPILMIAAGLALIVYGVTLTRWFKRRTGGDGPRKPDV